MYVKYPLMYVSRVDTSTVILCIPRPRICVALVYVKKAVVLSDCDRLLMHPLISEFHPLAIFRPVEFVSSFVFTVGL
jgi:hypothetical protein